MRWTHVARIVNAIDDAEDEHRRRPMDNASAERAGSVMERAVRNGSRDEVDAALRVIEQRGSRGR